MASLDLKASTQTIPREMVIRQISQMPPTFSAHELFENLQSKIASYLAMQATKTTLPALPKNQRLLEKMADFGSFASNWDGLDAEPPSPATLENAQKTLAQLDKMGIEAEFVGPSPNAEIMFELKRGADSMEIYVLEDHIEALHFRAGDLLEEGTFEALLTKTTHLFAAHG